jgi:hypothetical protein
VSRDVSSWHTPEVPARLIYVGYWGKTGKHLLAGSLSQFGPTTDMEQRPKIGLGPLSKHLFEPIGYFV